MLNPNYIVGLIDGEGSFTVYIRNPDDKKVAKRRVTAEPKFYVKLIEKDKRILFQLKKYFGCGNVYFQKDNRPNHHHCYRYEVTNLREITENIIPFFDQHPLQGNKAKDYALFKKIVKAVLNKEHQTKKGLERIRHLKEKMHIYWAR